MATDKTAVLAVRAADLRRAATTVAAALLGAVALAAAPAWAQATPTAPPPHHAVAVRSAESAHQGGTFCVRYGFVGVICTEDHSS